MSQVNELFDRALALKKGKKLTVKCTDVKQVHSIRTMFYRQAARYEKQTGNSPELMCSKEGTDLVIMKRSFIIEED